MSEQDASTLNLSSSYCSAPVSEGHLKPLLRRAAFPAFPVGNNFSWVLPTARVGRFPTDKFWVFFRSSSELARYAGKRCGQLNNRTTNGKQINKKYCVRGVPDV